MLRVLEGAAAYVFASPGCKKWDTAAPQAILEAAGELASLAGVMRRDVCVDVFGSSMIEKSEQ